MPLSAFNILLILHCSEQSVQSVGLNPRFCYLSSDSPSLILNKKHWLVNPQLDAFCSLSLSITLHLIYPNTEGAFRLRRNPRLPLVCMAILQLSCSFGNNRTSEKQIHRYTAGNQMPISPSCKHCGLYQDSLWVLQAKFQKTNPLSPPCQEVGEGRSQALFTN